MLDHPHYLVPARHTTALLLLYSRIYRCMRLILWVRDVRNGSKWGSCRWGRKERGKASSVEKDRGTFYILFSYQTTTLFGPVFELQDLCCPWLAPCTRGRECFIHRPGDLFAMSWDLGEIWGVWVCSVVWCGRNKYITRPPLLFFSVLGFLRPGDISFPRQTHFPLTGNRFVRLSLLRFFSLLTLLFCCSAW